MSKSKDGNFLKNAEITAAEQRGWRGTAPAVPQTAASVVSALLQSEQHLNKELLSGRARCRGVFSFRSESETLAG